MAGQDLSQQVLYYHREYLDPSLAPFGEPYFQYLRFIYSTGQRWYTGVRVTEKFVAHLKLDGPHMHVRMMPQNVAWFEFATSGFPVVTGSYTIDTLSGTTYRAMTVPALAVVQASAIVLKPEIYFGRAPAAGMFASKVNRPYQINLIDEPVGFPPSATSTYPTVLYESWAPGHTFTGAFETSLTLESSIASNPRYGTAVKMPWSGNYTTFATRDVGIDVPFARAIGKSQARFAFLSTQSDWPRANGVQTVTHATYGTRTFAIMVDAFGDFFAFPTSQVEPRNGTLQNVNSTYVKTQTPTLPTWCWKPPGKAKTDFPTVGGSTWLNEYPDVDWKFNSVGTKACCIYLQREAAAWDETYFTGLNPSWANPYTSWMGYTGINSRWDSYSNGTVDTLYTYGPGLVEATVTITLTGPNPEDFTLSVSVAAIRTPTTTDRCTLLAGYSWVDKTVNGVSIAVDDLLTFDIERWYDVSYENKHFSTEGGTDYTADFDTSEHASFFRLRKASTETDVRAFAGESIVACDMRTLSFVFELEHREDVDRTLDRGSGWDSGIYAATLDLPYRISHPAMAVWVMGELKETMTPTDMDSGLVSTLGTLASSNPATAVSGWTYLPFNDLRNWADDDLSFLRDMLIFVHNWHTFGWTTPDLPIVSGDLTSDTKAWWLHGICVNSNQNLLIFATEPNFGWAAYTSEIMNRLQISPHTTFFTHPRGHWAFFNQERIYNKVGVVDWDRDIDSTNVDTAAKWIDYDSIYTSFTTEPYQFRIEKQMLRFGCPNASDWGGTHLSASEWHAYKKLTPMQATGVFQHCIFDRVHFTLDDPANPGTPVVLDTTFREIYNAAVVRSVGDAAAQTAANIKEVALSDMLATFTAEGYTYNYAAEGNLSLRLKMEIGTETSYLYDSTCEDPCNGYSIGLTYDYQIGGAAYKPLLTGLWYLDNYLTDFTGSGDYHNIPLDKYPVRFSSATLIGEPS